MSIRFETAAIEDLVRLDDALINSGFPGRASSTIIEAVKNYESNP